MTNKMTQNERLLIHFRAGQSIDAKTALKKYGITRLSARIRELRLEGYPIFLNINYPRKFSYCLGQATKEIVSTAFSSAGSSIFR